VENNIKDYIHSARQVGHTSLIMNNLKDVDKPFYVLGGYMNNSREMVMRMGNKNAIPVSLSSHMRGAKYPLIIDNHAYTLTCENYEKEISGLHTEYAKQMRKLREEKRELQKINRSFAKRNNYLMGQYHAEIKRNREYKTTIDRLKESIKAIKYSKKGLLNSMTLFQRVFKIIKK
jgi:hypothetical protein